MQTRESAEAEERGVRSFVGWAFAVAGLLIAGALLLWIRYGAGIFFDALASLQTCL